MDLYKSKNWKVIFADWCQEFPGQCIVTSKKEKLSDLTGEDWEELGVLEKELERVTRMLFDATMFNFACLMNEVYRDNEEPHVNFQFIPRYSTERTILYKKYKDKHFGYNMWNWSLNRLRRQKDIFTEAERFKLYQMMKEEWKVKPVKK